MEAFDQPWKSVTEGAVGAYWGVFDVNRQPKFPLTSPIVEIPEWRTLAAISVAIAVITFALLLIDSRTFGNAAAAFSGSSLFLPPRPVCRIVYSYTRQYITVTTGLVGLLMIVGPSGRVWWLLREAHECAEPHGRRGEPARSFAGPGSPAQILPPMFSVDCPGLHRAAGDAEET